MCYMHFLSYLTWTSYILLLVGFYWSFYYVVPTVNRNENTEDNSELQKKPSGCALQETLQKLQNAGKHSCWSLFFSLVTGWTIFRAHPDDIFF